MSELQRRRAAASKAARTRRRMTAARSTEHTADQPRVPRGTRPPGAIGPRVTRTMLALLAVHHRDGRATIRSVAARAGLRSTRNVQEDLQELAAEGLVEVGVPGALRPMVTAHHPITTHHEESTA